MRPAFAFPTAFARPEQRSLPRGFERLPEREKLRVGGGGTERAALTARWYELTRTVLPGLAHIHRWPIHLDHCFMRVCLDAAVGSPWHAAVKRPAVRRMTDVQLAAAVRVAEGIAAEPATLPALNAASLRGRERARRNAGH